MGMGQIDVFCNFILQKQFDIFPPQQTLLPIYSSAQNTGHWLTEVGLEWWWGHWEAMERWPWSEGGGGRKAELP